MCLKNLVVMASIATTLLSAPLFAKNDAGDETNASKEKVEAASARVASIRSDLLKWINEGGAKDLNLPNGVSYDQYVSSMTEILQSNELVLDFTEEDYTQTNVAKFMDLSCQGFIATEDFRPHIQCNINRFNRLGQTGQYEVVHHVFAGLKKLEIDNSSFATNPKINNSTYPISEQVIDYLVGESNGQKHDLKLAVKKIPRIKPISKFYRQDDDTYRIAGERRAGEWRATDKEKCTIEIDKSIHTDTISIDVAWVLKSGAYGTAIVTDLSKKEFETKYFQLKDGNGKMKLKRSYQGHVIGEATLYFEKGEITDAHVKQFNESYFELPNKDVKCGLNNGNYNDLYYFNTWIVRTI